MWGRAVIDIGDIDISIKISCDIDIDTEIVDIDILELGVTPVLDLSSLTITRNWLQARLTVYPPQYADQNPVNLSKIFFFSIKLPHAHLQYVCNIPTMH